jgi:hypothetical protein
MTRQRLPRRQKKARRNPVGQRRRRCPQRRGRRRHGGGITTGSKPEINARSESSTAPPPSSAPSWERSASLPYQILATSGEVGLPRRGANFRQEQPHAAIPAASEAASPAENKAPF